MTHKISTSWINNMQFDALIDNHHVVMDSSAETDGHDKGPRPKKLMLAALAGCTGMDVISILKKMRVEPEEFTIDIEADLTEEHPKHYSNMHVIYYFKGENLDYEKLKKAVDLSQDKYCGVSAAYKKAMKITYEIKINN